MKSLLIGFLLTLASTSYAFTVSSDDQYYVYDDGSYRFIYSDEYRPFLKALMANNSTLKAFYEKDFGWKLDEKPYLILASPRNQIANGFATTLPTLHTVFYGGGAESVDEFAAASWVNTLLTHETSHLYQTDAKQGYSRTLKRIFGNATPDVAIPFTYMISPNIFLPTFILEGNATYNEGRFGNGGRLYNGENRALFLSLLKSGKVTSKRLMNDHIMWPYGREKYLVGAYVHQYLGQKYGVDKVNAFFMKNAEHYVNPFLLRKSFVETFGVGYEEVIRDLNAQFGPMASTMKTIDPKYKTFATSITNGGFTRADSRVIFMTTDGFTWPELYLISKNANGLKTVHERRNLPFGKPLFWNKKVYVPSSETVSANAIRYSFFEEGFKRDTKFDNKFVYDTADADALVADVPTSFAKVQLYNNSKFVGEVSSTGQYDEDKKPLYFTQSGDQRTLLRDGQPLVTYKGYYGKVADATKNGDVYIIAATEKGSGLFRVRNGSLARVLSADTIVDAAVLSDTEVVVSEMTDHGYDFKVVPLETEINETPFYYEYFYDKDASMKLVTSAPQPTVEETRQPNAMKLNEERKYSTLRYTKFDGLDPFIAGFNAAGDLIAGIGVRFSDAMQFHSLSLTYAHMEGDTHDAAIAYTNRFYKLNWTLAGTFDQSVIANDEGTADERILARYQTYSALFQLDYPIYQAPQSGMDFTTRYEYEYDDSNDTGFKLDREQSVLTYIDWYRSREFPISYESSLLDSFTLAHKAIGDIPKWEGNRNKYAAQVSVMRDIWNQSFVNAGYHIVKSDSPNRDIEIDSISVTGLDVGFSDPTDLERYSSDSGIRYQEAHQFTAGLKKAFLTPIYFTKFPLSLRRMAPFVTYNEFYGKGNRDASLQTLFHEVAYGAEFELLFIHKFAFRITAAGVDSSARKNSDFTTFATIGQKF